MEDREKLKGFIAELTIEQISDIEDLKDFCYNIDKYLEQRLGTIKNSEAEIFAKCIKLADMRSKMLNSLKTKIKAAETMIPYQDTNLRKYFLNRVFCFDATSDKVFEVEEFALPKPIADKFKGKIPTKLILKDSRARIIEYVLIYSIKTYRIEEVHNFDMEKDELKPTEHHEIENLIGKLKSFVGDNYCGTRNICIADLQAFLDHGDKDYWDKSESKLSSQTDFFFTEED
jgi:hypothetical protein